MMTKTERTLLDAIVDRIREINDDIAHYEAVPPRHPDRALAQRSLIHLRGEKAFLSTIASQLEMGDV